MGRPPRRAGPPGGLAPQAFGAGRGAIDFGFGLEESPTADDTDDEAGVTSRSAKVAAVVLMASRGHCVRAG